MTLHGMQNNVVSYETDRLKFIGRGNTLANPQAMHWSEDVSATLSNTQGSVLDPVAAQLLHPELVEPPHVAGDPQRRQGDPAIEHVVAVPRDLVQQRGFLGLPCVGGVEPFARQKPVQSIAPPLTYSSARL